MPPLAVQLAWQCRVEQDKSNVKMIINHHIGNFLAEAAAICKMSYPSNLTGQSEQCVSTKDIRASWLADGGETNQKRVAWMYIYYPRVLHKTILTFTHQEWVEQLVLQKLRVRYANIGNLPTKQKTCVQQVYAMRFNEFRSNLSRKSNLRKASGVGHTVQVLVGSGLSAELRPKPYKRAKTKFLYMGKSLVPKHIVR